MTFINDDNEVLEVAERMAITKQAVSIFNFEIKGDFSVTFKVDNNSYNRKVLKYYGQAASPQGAWQRKPFSLMREGNIFIRGSIVIQTDNGNYLDCFFISGNASWFNLFQFPVTELDLRKYITRIDSATIVSLTSATSGIIYPIADWGYNFQKAGNDFNLSVIDQSNSLDNTLMDFYPCMYLSTLIQEIFEQNGIKIAGNLLDEPLYKSLVIGPDGQMKRDPIPDITAVGASQFILGGAAPPLFVKYISFTETSDPENLFANNTYTAIRKEAIYISYTYTSVTPFGSILHIYKNGVSVYSDTFTTAEQGLSYQTQLFSVVPGDTFEVYIERNPTQDVNVAIDIKIQVPEVIGDGDYIDPKYFLPDIECLDLVKFAVNYFGCEVSYDEYSKTVTANIIEKIKVEDAQDWSAYYNSHRVEYSVDTAENNYLKFSKNDSDLDIKDYNKVNKLHYADGNIQTESRIKKDNDLIDYPFSPSSFGLALNSMFLTKVPLNYLKDNGVPQAYLSTSGVGSTTFSWSISSDIMAAGEVIKIVTNSGFNLGYFVVVSATDTSVTVSQDFAAEGGFIYRQAVSFNNIGGRILAVKPSTNVSDFSSQSSMSITDQSGTTTGITSIPYAVFSKSTTGKPIDAWKANCAIDNVNSSDPSVKELCFNKISTILNNPVYVNRFTLPESVFQSFDFTRFVYLKTEKLSGYFKVEAINNYQDSAEQTEVRDYKI